MWLLEGLLRCLRSCHRHEPVRQRQGREVWRFASPEQPIQIKGRFSGRFRLSCNSSHPSIIILSILAQPVISLSSPISDWSDFRWSALGLISSIFEIAIARYARNRTLWQQSQAITISKGKRTIRWTQVHGIGRTIQLPGYCKQDGRRYFLGRTSSWLAKPGY